MPPKLRSCARGGTVPSHCSPARAPTPIPSRCRVACAAALPSTSIASNPSLSVPGPRRPGARFRPGAGGREHKVELLLNRRRVRGVARYLRWRGHTSGDDEWLREEELLHCSDKVAE